ncbi:hypothetical protein [Rhizobium sp. M1]|uniref:hypothetical protein n=1 Tax=Rhizobium sp. M1 TaxID=2035453 RepID=UPI001144CB1A|nr:hypothetical protein [Rhizobium sp. M1]
MTAGRGSGMRQLSASRADRAGRDREFPCSSRGGISRSSPVAGPGQPLQLLGAWLRSYDYHYSLY